MGLSLNRHLLLVSLCIDSLDVTKDSLNGESMIKWQSSMLLAFIA